MDKFNIIHNLGKKLLIQASEPLCTSAWYVVMKGIHVLMTADETAVWWIFLVQTQNMNKESERNFSLTANWPLNQLCLLRYANDREAERWLKLPFNSTASLSIKKK